VEIDYSVHELVGSSNIPGKRSVRFAECELRFKDKDGERQEVNLVVCEPQLDDLIYQMTEALGVMHKLEGKFMN
jgi:hypothetical protein